jgi:N-acetyl-anhydromuramyl-L-alanine amidase AmpD
VFDAVSMHLYWSSAGFTEWNALRYRRFPDPGRPRFATECGRDQVRDGPDGTLIPPPGRDAYGWMAQGIDGDQYLAELAAYDAELRRDGVLGVVFTTSPDDEWTRKGYSIDALAWRCHGLTNLGPHDLEGRAAGALAWAEVAPIVKSVDQTAAIRRARPGAVTIYRRRFSPAEQDDAIARCDASHVVGRIVEGLAGFRHPNLYAELLNEIARDQRDAYARLAAACVPMLHAEGIKVAGPSWGTGDFEAEDWAVFAAADAGSVMPDWFPGATRRLITVNYTPGRASAVRLIVDHVTDGLGSPYVWFNTDRGEDGSSAHFCVLRSGEVEQYRPLSDTCWANGPVCQPDLGNPIIADLVGRKVWMNAATVAVEHEGKPGVPLAPAQIAASRQLHRWLSETLAIPLDRTHAVGHWQIDRCTRANCPGPTHPWQEILMSEPAPTQTVTNLQDETDAHAPLPAGPTAAPIAPSPGHWPNGRVIASAAEYDQHVWSPLFTAYQALRNGGNGDLGDDQDADDILAIKRRNEARHGIKR